MDDRIKKSSVWLISLVLLFSILSIPLNTASGLENNDPQDDPNYLFSLDLEEYEEYLEEGPISDVLIEAFEDEEFEIDEESELEKENGRWWVVDEGIKRYKIELNEDLIKIYTPFRFEINRPESTESYEEGEELLLNYNLTVDYDPEQDLTVELMVDGFEQKSMDINSTEEQEEYQGKFTYQGEFTWIVAGEPREAELGVRIEDYEETEVSVNVEVSELETAPFWLIILLFGFIGIIVVSFLVIKDKNEDSDIEEKNI